jgi:hypothetical protein
VEPVAEAELAGSEPVAADAVTAEPTAEPVKKTRSRRTAQEVAP